jgi:hypothetical protein
MTLKMIFFLGRSKYNINYSKASNLRVFSTIYDKVVSVFGRKSGQIILKTMIPERRCVSDRVSNEKRSSGMIS